MPVYWLASESPQPAAGLVSYAPVSMFPEVNQLANMAASYHET
jgi:hypothetical protein